MKMPEDVREFDPPDPDEGPTAPLLDEGSDEYWDGDWNDDEGED